jgi:GxxExxY protein
MQAVFEVHNTLGPGFIEQVYEEAVAYELELRQIRFARQKPIQIYYKDRLVGKHRLDLVVDDKIILELKAVSEMTKAFRQRTLSYLRAADLKWASSLTLVKNASNMIVSSTAQPMNKVHLSKNSLYSPICSIRILSEVDIN